MTAPRDLASPRAPAPPPAPDQDWAPRARLTKRFWTGCALILVSFSFVVPTALKLRDARALATSYVTLPATVIDNRAQSRNTTPAARYYLTYQFTLDTQTITNERRVPEQVFLAHPIGTTWDIAVHPDRPDLHDLFASETRQSVSGFAALSAITFVLGLLLIRSTNALAALRAKLTHRTS